MRSVSRGEHWKRQLDEYIDGLPKIFCCGLPRTGNMSLSMALQHLGIPTMHWLRMRREYLLKYFACGSLSHLRKVAKHILAWTGMPCFIMDDLLRLYPDAWWILLRRDPDKWADSLERHSKNLRLDMASKPADTWGRVAPIVCRHRIFGTPWPRRDAAIDAYHTHNERCLSMPFAKLLELDVSDGEATWLSLIKFLGVPFPKINQGRRIALREQ